MPEILLLATSKSNSKRNNQSFISGMTFLQEINLKNKGKSNAIPTENMMGLTDTMEIKYYNETNKMTQNK